MRVVGTGESGNLRATVFHDELAENPRGGSLGRDRLGTLCGFGRARGFGERHFWEPADLLFAVARDADAAFPGRLEALGRFLEAAGVEEGTAAHAAAEDALAWRTIEAGAILVPLRVREHGGRIDVGVAATWADADAAIYETIDGLRHHLGDGEDLFPLGRAALLAELHDWQAWANGDVEHLPEPLQEALHHG